MSNRRQFLARLGLVAVLPGRPLAQGLLTDMSKVGANHLQVLVAAMDEIIPKGDGMPSATEVGGPEYLQYLSWQYPSIQQEIAAFLDGLRRAAIARFGTEFLSLQHEQRVQLLANLEKDRAPGFAAFVGYVYEAYYTRPIVQGAVSCRRSPAVAEDLDTLLAPVRNMKRPYREVP